MAGVSTVWAVMRKGDDDFWLCSVHASEAGAIAAVGEEVESYISDPEDEEWVRDLRTRHAAWQASPHRRLALSDDAAARVWIEVHDLQP
jgi:hypothetical protein